MPGRNPMEPNRCTLQMRCDGDIIPARKKNQSMCGKCEAAINKRNKSEQPLKGERYVAYSATREK